MRKVLVFLSFVLLLSACQEEQKKTFYFVRHAEKDSFNPKDPALTIDGVMRSVDLSKWFKDISVDTVLSSDTKRTMETAKPLSEDQQLTVGIYDPVKYEENVNSWLEMEADTIVVIGHSNTILKQIEAFGAKPEKEGIGENEYDKIYQLSLKDKSVQIHQFGSKTE